MHSIIESTTGNIINEIITPTSKVLGEHLAKKFQEYLERLEARKKENVKAWMLELSEFRQEKSNCTLEFDEEKISQISKVLYKLLDEQLCFMKPKITTPETFNTNETDDNEFNDEKYENQVSEEIKLLWLNILEKLVSGETEILSISEKMEKLTENDARVLILISQKFKKEKVPESVHEKLIEIIKSKEVYPSLIHLHSLGIINNIHSPSDRIHLLELLEKPENSDIRNHLLSIARSKLPAAYTRLLIHVPIAASTIALLIFGASLFVTPSSEVMVVVVPLLCYLAGVTYFPFNSFLNEKKLAKKFDEEIDNRQNKYLTLTKTGFEMIRYLSN